MKKFLFVILLSSIGFVYSSCFREVILPKIPQPPSDALTRLLTSQTWVYYEYFTHFDSVSASLAWKQHPLVDSLNLSPNQVTYHPDGTYTEITQTGATLNGTWSFINGEKGTQVVNSEGTFTSTIEELTNQRYEWLASNGNYGVMVPKGQTIDTAGGRLALITAHQWVYSEYFFNFNQAVPSLVWKPNLPAAEFNLSLNVVKFNTDGTYWETDQYGNLYNGAWSFTNNQTGTVVVNSLGTFASNIELLDTARFEWYDGVNHYGEMVPQ